LCRAELAVGEEPSPKMAQRLYLRSRATNTTADAADLAQSPGARAYSSAIGIKMTTDNPLVIAMLDTLIAISPAVVSFVDLHATVRRLLADSRDDVRALSDGPDVLAAAAMQLRNSGHTEFRSAPSAFTVSPSMRPKASPLARWQASSSELVTSIGHWAVELNSIARFVLLQLDGTLDRTQVARVAGRALETGDLLVEGRRPSAAELEGVVDDTVSRLARLGVIVR
jgi:methyltransferase-like protein